MKKLAITTAAALTAFCAWGEAPFGIDPDWESVDERATCGVALADFNGDGWRVTNGERKTGDGQRHVFYLDHWPALTITAVRVDGAPVPRADYCFDARAGWLSLKNAPASGARVEVDYKWSNRLDFFAGNERRTQTDGRDVIYFNDKRNIFDRSPGWFSESEDNPSAVAEADFDADGDVDVAIGGEGFVKVYRNAGSGLETKPSWTSEIPIWWVYFGLAWGDVDNDGYLELAVTDWGWDTVSVYKNRGGTLERSPSWEVTGKSWVSPAWGDMDGDGDMDLAVGTLVNSTIPDGRAYVFRNVGGVLERTPCWRGAGPEGRVLALAWGDVNGDGWLDLVKGIRGRGTEHDPYADIYYSDRGVLPTAPSWESEYYTHCYTSCLVDADGDGEMDLLQSVGSGVAGYFWKGGSLEKIPSWRHVYTVTLDIGVGDVNADGFPDLIAGGSGTTSSPKGSRNRLFLNKGDIGVNVKNFSASSRPRGVALRWEVNEAVAGFNLLRDVKAADVATEPVKINEKLITGRSPYRFIDRDVKAGKTYQYWLEVVPLSGPAERHGPVECTVGVKASFALAQNVPNPARTTTTFAFSVTAACDATLAVYDIAGRKVASHSLRAERGENELDVDVSSLAPGVYTYRLEAGGEAAAKRMVVVR